MKAFRRPYASLLATRLVEPRRFIIAVTGSRQVGKTTLVEQVVAESGLLIRYATADEPSLKGEGWLEQQWQSARLEAREWKGGAVLVLDAIQKAPAWSETVKRLWDEDTRAERPLRVIVLGSAPLTIYQGLTESLA